MVSTNFDAIRSQAQRSGNSIDQEALRRLMEDMEDPPEIADVLAFLEREGIEVTETVADTPHSDEIFAVYVNSIRKYPLLSREDEQKLGKALMDLEVELIKHLAYFPAAITMLIARFKAGWGQPHCVEILISDRLMAYRNAQRRDHVAQVEATLAALEKGGSVKQLSKLLFQLAPSAMVIDEVLTPYARLLELKAATALEPAHAQRMRDMVTALKSLREAKNKMICSNLRLVISVAKSYLNHGVDIEDLVQEGNMALMRAVDKFDHRLNFKFCTYASWWLRQAVTRSLTNHGRLIRVPVHMQATISAVRRSQHALAEQGIEMPSIGQISHASGIPHDKVLRALDYTLPTVSLQAPVGESQDHTIGDTIKDTSALDGVEHLQNSQLLAAIHKAIDTLSARERHILSLRFGLNGEAPRTLEEIGAQFSVTRERIRQIESKALKKLRHPERKQHLEGLLS